LQSEDYDSAVVLVAPPDGLSFPDDFIPFVPIGDTLPVGTEVGWMGYPTVDPDTLCFFSGRLSARKETGYFIDGVSINGISGGPVFHFDSSGNIQILGIVTEHHANRSTPGIALPGLMYAHGTARFSLLIEGMDAYFKSQQ
jgi:hypothetical protein